MSNDSAATRTGRSQLWPSIASQDDALRVLRRHWGGWVFGAANLLSAALAWVNLPGLPDQDGYRAVASTYFLFVALFALGLTWLVVHRKSVIAGFTLLVLVGLVVAISILSSDPEGGPIGPYFIFRLWIVNRPGFAGGLNS